MKPGDVCRVLGTVPGAHKPYKVVLLIPRPRQVLRDIWAIDWCQGCWRARCPLLSGP